LRERSLPNDFRQLRYDWRMKDSISLSLAMVITLVAIAAATETGAGELAPFASDGCSAFPEGTSEHQNLWLD